MQKENSVGKKNQAAVKSVGKKTYLLSDQFPMEEITLGETKKEVLDLIYKKGNPTSISKELKVARSTTIQHLNELRNKGLVKKGRNDENTYGDPWLVTEKGIYLREKCVGFPAKSSRVGRTNRGTLDDINGHAFVFTLELPKLTKWDKRTETLENKGISSEELTHLFGGGQKILLDGRKIHVTNKSIIIYESESYISELAKKSKSKAIYHFKILLKKLEKIFDEDFKQLGRYKFRVSRQHYALIQNSLAKQYNAENKKLEVFNGRGRLMYLIDDSKTKENIFGENHFEAVDSESSDKDITPVQNFFKALPEYPTTTKEILENFKETNERLKKLSEQNLQISQVMEQQQKNIVEVIKMNFKGK